MTYTNEEEQQQKSPTVNKRLVGITSVILWWTKHCYGLNVCVPPTPNTYVEDLTHSMMVSGGPLGGDLDEVIEDGSPHDGIGAL